MRPERRARLRGVAPRLAVACVAIFAAAVATGCQDRAARDGAPGQGSAAAGGSSKAAKTVTIAILPFDNTSGEKGYDYVGTGLAEEMALMVGALAPENVRVIAPESARWFKRSQQDVAAAATDLGAQFVVRGSVARAAEVVTIAAEIVPTAGGGAKWSDTRECDMKDAGAQLKEMARAVVGAATGSRAELVDREPARGVARYSIVYDSYIKARESLVEASPDALEDAIRTFENALEMDGDYRPTYLGIGLAYQAAGDLPISKWGARMNIVKARSRGMKSMEKGDEFCEARTLAAIAQMRIDGRWEQAEESFKRALTLNPSYVPAHLAYSEFLSAKGRTAEAIARATLACALDPLSATARAALGARRLEAGDTEGAAGDFSAAAALESTCLPAQLGLVSTHLEQKRVDEALAIATAAAEQSERSSPALAQLARALAAAGRTDEALALLAELEARLATKFVSPYSMAVIAASAGDTDKAFAMLDKALLDRPRAIVLIDRDPAMASLRQDPRYETVRIKLGLAAPKPQP